MLTSTMIYTENQVDEKRPERTFTFEEAFKKSLEYFNGDELAAKVWVNKYALKDSFGKIYELSPDDMHWRIARELARIERKYVNPMSEQEMYDLLKDFKYIVPQGSPMTGIGNKFQIASLSNCFVIGNEGEADSYGGIMKIDQEQAQLMKRRGGVGHDLSHIRPAGSPVLNSALTSTGVVTFMERYSNTTLEVAQDGRRGALMLSISSKHPDAESFIDAKMTPGRITGANVSVKIDDDFMNAVVNKEKYIAQFPVGSKNPSYTKEIDAQALWNKIIHNAWKSAEPGVLFWDTIIRESVPDCYAKFGYATVSTNPCGEIPLCPYDSCRLLAINLYSYVEKPFTKEARFNFDLFKKHVAHAQRIMDDIIDLELEKIGAILKKIQSDPEDSEIKRVERRLWEQIREKTEEGRRTGIGITAEGDMLAALGIRYGSEDSIDFSVAVHRTLAVEAYRGSVNLARERGAFTIYDSSLERGNHFIERIKSEDETLYREMQRYGRRNIALLTIAPTGSTSLMTQTSSGIEPAFALYYKRRRKVNPNDRDVVVSFTDDKGIAYEEYIVFHHKFIEWLKINGYNVKEALKYNEKQLNELVEKSPYKQATANDIDWLNKVRMQGEIQKWVDHSISVTINMPENVSEDMVGQLYIAAWKNGCKGMTVYREGSREGILISAKSTGTPSPRRRPVSLDAEIIRFKNNKEDWIAFIGLYEERPYEIFTGIHDDEVLLIPKSITKGKILKVKGEDGKKRYDFQYIDRFGYANTVGGLSHTFAPEYWNYAKLISSVLRFGMPILDVVNLVSSLHLDNASINTWKNGVERALKKYIPDGTKATKGNVCPEPNCEGEMIYQDGCPRCANCGHQECG